MATDATGTPTTLGIPTFNINVDAPSGNGSNAQMTSIDTLLQARATLASPAFTGTPTAPTPITADNSTKIATTAYVKAQGFITSSAVTSVFGRSGAVVAASGDYTVAQVTGAAPLASPTFTGTPAAPTPATADNSTTIATTAFVKAQGYLTSSTGVSSFNGRTGAVSPTSGDYTAAQVTNAADKSSASAQQFTGAVTSQSVMEAEGFFPFVNVGTPVSINGTFTPDTSQGMLQTVNLTTAGGTLTIANPTTNTPNINTLTGLMIVSIINSDGITGETLSWGAEYQFSAVPKPTTIAAATRKFILFIWDTVSHGWYAVGAF